MISPFKTEQGRAILFFSLTFFCLFIWWKRIRQKYGEQFHHFWWSLSREKQWGNWCNNVGEMLGSIIRITLSDLSRRFLASLAAFGNFVLSISKKVKIIRILLSIYNLHRKKSSLPSCEISFLQYERERLVNHEFYCQCLFLYVSSLTYLNETSIWTLQDSIRCGLFWAKKTKNVANKSSHGQCLSQNNLYAYLQNLSLSLMSEGSFQNNFSMTFFFVCPKKEPYMLAIERSRLVMKTLTSLTCLEILHLLCILR